MSDINGSNKNVFDNVLPKVMQTVRASSALAAQDVNFYKSLDSGLSKQLDHTGDDLLNIVNSFLQLTSTDFKPIKLGKENITSESSWKPVSNILDNVFEKIDIVFDECERGSKNKNSNKVTYLEEGTSINDNNSVNTGKTLTKPQLEFKKKIDNSEEHPFIPKITNKPNSIKNFDESTQLITPNEPTYTEEGDQLLDPPYYPQPYEFEINNQPYPESILKKSEPIPSRDWTSTSAIWVDTQDKLTEMINQLRGLTEIAVDLEHHDYRTYYGLVCLMQISNREQDWIVDTLKLRDDLEPLNEIFTNPEIIKVFHGAFMDIIWLQRDLGLYIVSLFDTYHASKKLGFPKFSLAYLLETFANFKTSKKYQLADWRVRPLLNPMLAYARSDTHFLLNIFDQLRNKLIESDEKVNENNEKQNKLQQVLYESRQVSNRRFEYTKFRPVQMATKPEQLKVSCPIMSSNPKEPYGSIMYQYNVPNDKKPIIEVLYNWRDLVARENDESVRYVMSNQTLVGLASLNQPITPAKVLGVSNYISEFVRLNARELSEIIEDTLKRMESNEWKLSDHLKEEINKDDDDFFENGKVNINKLSHVTAAFELLVNKNGDNDDVNEKFEKINLVSDESKLLSNILEKANNQFSIEYDIKNGEKIEHTISKDYNKRLEFVLHTFNDIEEQHQQQQIKIQNINVDENEDELKHDQGEGEREDIIKDNKDIDPNEVITLRKKRRQVNTQGSKDSNVQVSKDQEQDQEQSQAPSFDYANADKIMIDTNDRRKKNKKDVVKKRSFDPYSKENGGPQPSKKSRKMNSGKTTTFTSKKRR